jgi:cold shock protein
MTQQQGEGTVKLWTQRGFGFVRPDDNNSTDLFLHITALTDRSITDLAVGDRVRFNVKADREGRPRAVDVELVDD